ncbi:MAG: ATP-sensitive inward rectifier potassium channel 10 [Scytonematopsis contorta HA4267-MV1]|jgi:inward rectifier potassium channel|nr:ATP-sensitive inward rectifier potassium channel 10 [Scytonematopsis contorta HA4267-MV1]
MRFRLPRFVTNFLHRPYHSIRVAKREGKFHIEGIGNWYMYLTDPYHLILTIPWLGFFIIVSLTYILINAIFALLYLAGGNCLNNAHPGSFADAFFFSVQTLSTIGYGDISPKTPFANIVVMLQAIVGLLVVAIVTGLSFTRFTKLTHRVVFSQVAVIAPHNDVPTLMFRMMNQRRNQILETELRVYLLRDEITTEGKLIYKIHELKMLQSHAPSLTLSWTAMHPIDVDSPLYGVTQESLVDNHVQIVVCLSGIDDIVFSAIQTQYTYAAKEIFFNYRFMDLMSISATGDRHFKPVHFHTITPIEAAEDMISQPGRGFGLV